MAIRCLVTGASGFIGGYVARKFARSGWEVTGTYFSTPVQNLLRRSLYEVVQVDLCSWNETRSLMREKKFDVVIHAAAEANIGLCENDHDRAFQANVHATKNILSACSLFGCGTFVFLSTDMVFDGAHCPVGGFSELRAPIPQSIYSVTKFQAECFVSASDIRATILRLSLVYGPGHRNCVGWIRERAANGLSIPLFTDEFRSPLYVGDIPLCIEKLCEFPSPPKVLHLAGPERMSRSELGESVADIFSLPKHLLHHLPKNVISSPFIRPDDLSLSVAGLHSQLGISPRGIYQGLSSVVQEELCGELVW